MELRDAMTTLASCRFFRPDPVPDEVFARAIDMARFGPSGGNRQPVRFIVVRDPDKRREMGEWYLARWERYVERLRSGASRIDGAQAQRNLDNTDAFARAFGEHPAIVIVCARMGDLLATDQELGRLSIVGGASVYPVVHNFQLALHEQGLGTTLTTMLCADEPRARELFQIPEEFGTAAYIAVGYPAQEMPRRLSRLPVRELAFADTFGEPLGGT